MHWVKCLLINPKLHPTLNNVGRQSFRGPGTVNFIKINTTRISHLIFFLHFSPLCSCSLVLFDHLQLTPTSPSPNWSGHCFNNQHHQFAVHPGTDVLCTANAPNTKLKIAEIRWLKKKKKPKPTSFQSLCYCTKLSGFLQNGSSFVKTHFSLSCPISVSLLVLTSVNILKKNKIPGFCCNI